MIGRASNPDDVVAASNTRASSSDWAAVDSDDMPHGTCPVGLIFNPALAAGVACRSPTQMPMTRSPS
ncbi:hypothetical protein G6F68_021786 [Rhizopus microsporus]|nr:hypothetical protein G6F68_021786 [Rhizopus microsporus]